MSEPTVEQRAQWADLALSGCASEDAFEYDLGSALRGALAALERAEARIEELEAQNQRLAVAVQMAAEEEL